MTTAARAFLARAARHPGRVAYRTLAAGGAPADAAMTWGEWADAARRFAAALVADGLRPGDTVAILAATGTLWPIADLGVLLAGGVSVGIYPTSAPRQVRQIVADCGARVLVVDTHAQLAKALAVRPELPALRRIVAGDAFTDDVVPWSAWLAHGEQSLEAASAEIDRRVASASADDTAILIYTSGSTGEPKGAEISHRYLLASAASIAESLGLRETDTTLSFLPFCHAAERIFGLYTRIHAGMEAALVPDHTRIWAAAHAYAPTLFGGLPRFYEKAYEALHAEHLAASREASAPRGTAWSQLGTARSRLVQARQFVPPTLEEEWREAGAPLFERARGLFGGRVRRATSGGAALPVRGGRVPRRAGHHRLGRLRADRAPVRGDEPPRRLPLRQRRPRHARHRAAHRGRRRDPDPPRRAHLHRLPRPAGRRRAPPSPPTDGCSPATWASCATTARCA